MISGSARLVGSNPDAFPRGCLWLWCMEMAGLADLTLGVRLRILKRSSIRVRIEVKDGVPGSLEMASSNREIARAATPETPRSCVPPERSVGLR